MDRKIDESCLWELNWDDDDIELCEGCGAPLDDCICPPAEWYEDPTSVQERIYELSHDMTAEFIELHRHPRDCNCPGCNGSGDELATLDEQKKIDELANDYAAGADTRISKNIQEIMEREAE